MKPRLILVGFRVENHLVAAFILGLIISSMSLGLWIKNPIGVVVKIPGEFSPTPVLDQENDGTQTRMWVPRGESFEKHDRAIRFVSLPAVNQTVDSHTAETKQKLEKSGCLVQVTASSADFYAPDTKAAEGKTTERILAFTCDANQEVGVHRILAAADKQYGGSIFVVSYLAKISSPKCPSMEEMQSALLKMPVMLQEPPKRTKPKDTQK